MSEELLNLSNERLQGEDLDIEAHAKKEGEEAEGKDEVEGHLLLDEDLLEL